ncbi:MAG: hypothetical protein FWB86_14825 [Treponema sp.]|nr:hypothetical protein [Treponema sp.]
MDLKDFSEAEKNILRLAVKYVGKDFTKTAILKETALSEEEAEKIMNSLISKGITSEIKEKTQSGEITKYNIKYGLRDNNFVNMEDELDKYNKYWDDYQDYIRGSVCP